MTPHKALRRVADHLPYHLRFTEVDLDETASRLTRLAACYQARLGGLGALTLDGRPDEATWIIREVDPPPELWDLHTHILSGRLSTLAWITDAPATVAAHRPGSVNAQAAVALSVPRQLPPGIADFAGQAAELALLEELFAAGDPGGPRAQRRLSRDWSSQ